jgi:hypothetical protein
MSRLSNQVAYERVGHLTRDIGCFMSIQSKMWARRGQSGPDQVGRVQMGHVPVGHVPVGHVPVGHDQLEVLC